MGRWITSGILDDLYKPLFCLVINHYSVATMVSIIELLVRENGSGDVDDMGKARMWRERESWGSRTSWHGRVVDRRWHLKKLEFSFVFNLSVTWSL